VRLNLKTILETLRDMRNYIFPVQKITSKFRSINSIEDLKDFIQQRSAHVTQTTLYGYLKTRIGSRYALMFEDEEYLKSINIAKWNIYIASIADCTLYVFSYLKDLKNFDENGQAQTVFTNILDEERTNGLDNKILSKAKEEFDLRLKTISWNDYYKNKPFFNSCEALYKWAPIADELKILDKEIVLNSISLKWNIVENEFKELTN